MLYNDAVEEVFSKYFGMYNHIFEKLYPAKNSTGFPERNLSVNFSKAMEQVAESRNQDCFTWYELQFGKKNNLHYDAVIFNMAEKKAYIVESKRFTNISKIKDVADDVERIDPLRVNDDQNRIDLKGFSFYGMILADVWTENNSKRNILKSFVDKNFFDKYEKTLNCKTKPQNVYYWTNQATPFEKVPNYYLLAAMWKINY